MEALEEEQQGEESDKTGGKVIPEYSEGQACLGDRIPGALNQVLKVDGQTYKTSSVELFVTTAYRELVG